MWRTSLLRCVPLLLVLSPSVFGHLSFNLAVDGEGNVYFLDIFGNSLMKVTADGRVSELVDLRGISPEERLHALAMDGNEHLYIGGYLQEKIWKVSPGGEVSSFYPFHGREPRGSQILHIGLDDSGALYFMDWRYLPVPEEGKRFGIFRVSEPENEPLELFVCNEGSDDFLDFHSGSMLVTGDGTLYFSNANRIWRLGRDRKLVAIAGSEESGHADGRAREARFDWPYGMAVDGSGNLLVAELKGRIRRIDPEGVVTTVAGGEKRGYVDGPLTEARFERVFAVGVGPEGRLYVAEYAAKEEYRIRVLSGEEVRTLARIPSDGTFRK